ncbi:MAG: hypothetical protein VKK32_01525 [Candidatus Melainabacteria bacterium]|nr:hypothetical protein [Candidatus Melainabacteria bacterium]
MTTPGSRLFNTITNLPKVAFHGLQGARLALANLANNQTNTIVEPAQAEIVEPAELPSHKKDSEDPLTQEIKQIIRSSHEPSIRIDSSHSWDVLCQISTDESSKSCLVGREIIIDLSGFQDDLNGLNLDHFQMSGLDLVFKVPAQYASAFTRKIQTAVREQESQTSRDNVASPLFTQPKIFLGTVANPNK